MHSYIYRRFSFLFSILSILRVIQEVWLKMVVQEDLELKSSHRHTKITAIYTIVLSKKDMKTS